MPVKAVLNFTLNFIENENQQPRSVNFAIEKDLNTESTSEDDLKAFYDQVANEMWTEFQAKFDAKIAEFSEKERQDCLIEMKREKKIVDDEEQDLYVLEGGNVTLGDNLQGNNKIHKPFIVEKDFICERHNTAAILGRNIAEGAVAAAEAALPDDNVQIGVALTGAFIVDAIMKNVIGNNPGNPGEN